MIMPLLALIIIFFIFGLTKYSNIKSTSDGIIISHGSGYIDESGNGFYHVIENEEI